MLVLMVVFRQHIRDIDDNARLLCTVVVQVCLTLQTAFIQFHFGTVWICRINLTL